MLCNKVVSQLTNYKYPGKKWTFPRMDIFFTILFLVMLKYARKLSSCLSSLTAIATPGLSSATESFKKNFPPVLESVIAMLTLIALF